MVNTGVRVGRGAVIGANAVVLDNMPDHNGRGRGVRARCSPVAAVEDPAIDMSRALVLSYHSPPERRRWSTAHR